MESCKSRIISFVDSRCSIKKFLMKFLTIIILLISNFINFLFKSLDGNEIFNHRCYFWFQLLQIFDSKAFDDNKILMFTIIQRYYRCYQNFGCWSFIFNIVGTKTFKNFLTRILMIIKFSNHNNIVDFNFYKFSIQKFLMVMKFLTINVIVDFNF